MDQLTQLKRERELLYAALNMAVRFETPYGLCICKHNEGWVVHQRDENNGYLQPDGTWLNRIDSVGTPFKTWERALEVVMQYINTQQAIKKEGGNIPSGYPKK